MENKLDVVLISAYGRGHWLATELKDLGLEVGLVDVTESLGRWAPEDWEGPVGLFQTEHITANQAARLDQEDYSEPVDDGFVVWLKSGPIDLRGSHSNYLLEKRQVDPEIQKYILEYSKLKSKEKEIFIKKWRDRSFAETWFLNLAHYLGSPWDVRPKEAFEYGVPLPLFAPYAIRRVTRRGMEKSLDWLKSRQVKVFDRAKVKDISILGAQLTNVEIVSEWSGVLGADQFVWSLTSQESGFINKNFASALFPRGELQGEWYWARYRVELSAEDLAETIPAKFLVIQDLAMPWSHANFIWVQRTVNEDSYDVWVKVPTSHRFEKNYIENLAGEISDVLTARIPGLHFKVTGYPQSYMYDESQLGPALIQNYSLEKWLGFQRRKLKNIHYDGPETWLKQDWSGQFQHQKSICERIEAWKVERDRKAEKMRAKEAQQ